MNDNVAISERIALIEFYQRQSELQIKKALDQSKVNGYSNIYTPAALSTVVRNGAGLEDHNRAVLAKAELDSYFDTIFNRKPNPEETINKVLSKDKVKREEAKKEVKKMEATPQVEMVISFDKKESDKMDAVLINADDGEKLVDLWSQKGVGVDIEGEITEADRTNPDIFIKTKAVYDKDNKKTGKFKEVGKRHLSSKEKAISLYKTLMAAAGVDVKRFKDKEFSRRLNSFYNDQSKAIRSIKKGDLDKVYDDLKLSIQRNSIKAPMSVDKIIALKGNYFTKDGKDFNLDILTGVENCLTANSAIKSEDLIKIKAIHFARRGEFGAAVDLVWRSLDRINNETIAKKFVGNLANDQYFPFMELEKVVKLLIETGVEKSKDHLNYIDVIKGLIHAYSRTTTDDGKGFEYWPEEKIVDIINSVLGRVNSANDSANYPMLEGGTKVEKDEVKDDASVVTPNVDDKSVDNDKGAGKKPEKSVEPEKAVESKKTVEPEKSVDKAKAKSTPTKSEEEDVIDRKLKLSKDESEKLKAEIKARVKKDKKVEKDVVKDSKDASKDSGKVSGDKPSNGKVVAEVKDDKAVKANVKSDAKVKGEDGKKSVDKKTEGEPAKIESKTTVKDKSEAPAEPKITGKVPTLVTTFKIDKKGSKVELNIPGTDFVYKHPFKAKELKNDSKMSSNLERNIKNGMVSRFKNYSKLFESKTKTPPTGFEPNNYKSGDPFVIDLKQAS